MAGNIRWKDGAWRLRAEAGPRDPITGQRKRVYETVHAPNNKRGRAIAEKRMAALITEIDSGRTVASSGMTLDELLERYINDRRAKWSPGSEYQTRKRIAQHISPHLGTTPIEKIRPVDVVRLHTIWRDHGMTDSAAGRIHDILRAALRQAVRWELIARNPASSDHVDRPTSKPPIVTLPSTKVLAAGLAKADDDLRVYLRIAALTGARRGEMVALRRSDINLKAKTILFSRAHVYVPGSGVTVKDTKEGVEHKVAIDAATVKAVRSLYARQAARALAVGEPLDDDPFLFAQDPVGSKAWHPHGATERWHLVRSKVKGLERTRLHDLRHWMATTLMELDGDSIQAANRGGWADPHEIHKRYGHHRPVKDQAAAKALAKRLDGGKAS